MKERYSGNINSLILLDIVLFIPIYEVRIFIYIFTCYRLTYITDYIYTCKTCITWYFFLFKIEFVYLMYINIHIYVTIYY